jgi:hypothetical protein
MRRLELFPLIRSEVAEILGGYLDLNERASI